MKARTSIRFAFAGLILTLLTACASEPIREIHYYLLDEAPTSQITRYRDSLIELEAIQLPKYLQENQLLLLEDDHRLTRANYHHWADDPAPSIWRALIGHLELNSTIHSFVDNCLECIRISVDIEHFYPTTNGDVLLSGNYEIYQGRENSDTSNQTTRQRFSFSTKIDRSGFPRSVELMNDLLGELSKHILSHLLD